MEVGSARERSQRQRERERELASAVPYLPGDAKFKRKNILA